MVSEQELQPHLRGKGEKRVRHAPPCTQASCAVSAGVQVVYGAGVAGQGRKARGQQEPFPDVPLQRQKADQPVREQGRPHFYAPRPEYQPLLCDGARGVGYPLRYDHGVALRVHGLRAFPCQQRYGKQRKTPRSYFLAGLPFLEKIFIGDGHNGEAAVQKTCSEIARHYDDLCDSIQQHIVDAQDDESEIDALNVHDMMASHPFWKHMVHSNPAPVCTLDWDSFREEAVVADGAGLNLLVLLSVGVVFKSNQDEWLSNDTSDFQETGAQSRCRPTRRTAKSLAT